MAHIYKRGRVWWIAYYRDKELVRESLRVRTGKEARKRRAEVEYDLLHPSAGENGDPTPPPVIPQPQGNGSEKPSALPPVPEPQVPPAKRVRVDVFLPDYYGFKRATREAKSFATDKSRIAMFFKSVGATYLDEITHSQVSMFLTPLIQTRKIGKKTYNDYRAAIHNVFQYAIERYDYVYREAHPNPVSLVRRFGENEIDRSEIRWLNTAQIREQLRVVASDAQLYAMVACYIYAGLRRAEIMWLRCRDVDLDAKVPMILVRRRGKLRGDGGWQPKTKKDRGVPLSKKLRRILRNYMTYRLTHFPEPRRSAEWFFPAPKGGRWNPDDFYARNFKAAQKKAGLNWTLLDLRHTFGSQLAKKGESLYKISTLMGNTPAVCRKHYAALIASDMQDTVEFAESEEDRIIHPRLSKTGSG